MTTAATLFQGSYGEGWLCCRCRPHRGRASGLLAQRDHHDLIALDYPAPGDDRPAHPARNRQPGRPPPAIAITSTMTPPSSSKPAPWDFRRYVMKGSDEGTCINCRSSPKRIIQQHHQAAGIRRVRRQSPRAEPQSSALLNRATQIFSSTLDETQVALPVGETSICEFTNTEGSSVWLWADDESNRLECVIIFSTASM